LKKLTQPLCNINFSW